MTQEETRTKNIEAHKFVKGQSGNPKGRPKNRVLALLKQIVSKGRSIKQNSDLTVEEINTCERMVLCLNISDLQLLAKLDSTNAYLKSLCMAIIFDMKNGRTNTVERLRDRQYGKEVQHIELTGANGTPLVPEKNMTPEEAKQLLKELEDEY
jgi:hypothetical protein